MAIIYVPPTVPGFDFSNFNFLMDLDFYDQAGSSATRFTLGGTGERTFSFTGTGFAYDTNPATGWVIPTAGEVTGFSLKNGTEVLLNISDFSVALDVVFDMLVPWGGMPYITEFVSGADTFRMTNGADKVRSFGGNDTINLNGGDDIAWGGLGNDKLNGGLGNDMLYGEAGADKLSGGVGFDTLVGGGGNDQFIFTITGPDNRKTITDFTSGADKLVFENEVFTGLATPGQLAAESFVLGLKAADASDRFIYDQATGSLWYDRDGKGGGGQTLIADLQDGAALVVSDILVI